MSFPWPDPSANDLVAKAQQARGTTSYLNDLNPEQRQAVETTQGPVLVLAGAGTGKTRVLTTRIAHLLASGLAPPHHILAVTFTNKAAHEMRARVGALIGRSVEGMAWLGTFHSIGRRIMARHAEVLGLTPNFTVLDTDDQIRLLKQILQAENIDEKRWPARVLASLIDNWKNRGQAPGDVPGGDAAFFANGRAIEFYKIYQERLKTLNSSDFGDLLLEPLRLLRTRDDIRTHYQQQFRYILVDEYQDTNVAQYLWLRLLTGDHANICCVGDDDQSIYGWRGAEVDNILRFEKDFPGAAVIRLERNYRSTGHILGAAAKLIAHNDERLGKTLFAAAHGDGEPVNLINLWDSEEEARVIGDEIEALQRKDHALSSMAILVRTTAQMREFEERFVQLGLPYHVVGGRRFYERQEIRDALAYLRVTVNPDDDLAFERIVNTPKRGLGEAFVQTLHHHARQRNISLVQAAETLVTTDELKPKLRSTIGNLLKQFSRWAQAQGTLPHTQLAELILEESGYMALWSAQRSLEAQSRLENLKELVNAIGEFDSLAAFLEHIALVTERETQNDSDYVTLMTLHAAKGLEFDTVFLPGWEDGLFPSQRSMDEKGRAGLEEERRLAYVGLTRAKQRSTISFVQSRRLHGQWSSTMPSRFLRELPPEHVSTATTPHMDRFGASSFQAHAFSGSVGTNRKTPGAQRLVERLEHQRHYPSARGTIIEGEAVAITQPEDALLGQRVFHQKFGYGRVAQQDGDKLTVSFDKAGEKRVLAAFVQRA